MGASSDFGIITLYTSKKYRYHGCNKTAYSFVFYLFVIFVPDVPSTVGDYIGNVTFC